MTISCKFKVGNIYRVAVAVDETLLLSASTGNFIAKVKWKVGGACLRRRDGCGVAEVLARLLLSIIIPI